MQVLYETKPRKCLINEQYGAVYTSYPQVLKEQWKDYLEQLEERTLCTMIIGLEWHSRCSHSIVVVIRYLKAPIIFSLVGGI